MTGPKILITSGESATSALIAKHLNELAPDRAGLEIRVCVRDQTQLPKMIQATLQKAERARIMECKSTTDAKALAECLRGIDTVALVPPPTADKFAAAKHWVQAASEAGIANAVLVSWAGCTNHGTGETGSHPIMCHFCDLEKQFNAASGIQNKAIVRAGFYAQNLLTYAAQIVKEHQLPAPTGNGKWAPLDADTLGKAMASMLAESPMRATFRGQTLTITGPESVSGPQLAQLVSQALGADVHFKNVSRDEAKTLLQKAPVISDAEIDALLEQYDLIEHGKLDFVAKDLEKVLDITHPPLKDVLARDATKFKALAMQPAV